MERLLMIQSKNKRKRYLIFYWTTKERIWKDSKSPVFPHLFLYLARVISLSGHLPGSIFSREGDIISTQNILISFKPIMYKLNYSHVIIDIIVSKEKMYKSSIIDDGIHNIRGITAAIVNVWHKYICMRA